MVGSGVAGDSVFWEARPWWGELVPGTVRRISCSENGLAKARRDAMPPRTCGTKLTWDAGGEGITAANHRVELEGRPPVEVSAAPRYRGDPTLLDPEELFVAAPASCQLLTYLALVQTPGLSHFFGCRPLGPVGRIVAGGASALATGASVLVPQLLPAADPWIEQLAAWVEWPAMLPTGASLAGWPGMPAGGGDGDAQSST